MSKKKPPRSNHRMEMLSLAISARRSRTAEDAKKTPSKSTWKVPTPQDDAVREHVSKLSLEGLRLQQKFLRDFQALKAQGRAYKKRDDEDPSS